MKPNCWNRISMAAAGGAAVAAVLVGFTACSGIKIDLGMKDPIKFEPIDVNMKVEVYQYTGKSEEEKEVLMNKKRVNERLYNRMAEIRVLKDSRIVGVNHRGLLSIRSLPAGDYGDYVRKTVDAENADRVFMMTDKANERGVELAVIEEESWRRQSQSAFKGEWIEIDGDAEDTYRWIRKKED